ncbi:bifunctional demethylmenaquinone methyltransferase/2-methoxy-6-polyprenyl-1,4-benzoquinol methylase UbiE [Clostridium kluyveri]|uniref:Demethylmenaquinone methyltransferase n=1 Tax=Clostridium kluyveri TaxID=1534 RepID=A0A1L5F795_CLOKL|nr:bifunctional demethylmenaquinone methyltransferase/2-methoxy-6-polyprenyl-1,4-benzoquinol methylase UbiE [Clostridium kluyveri]APM38875.1 bifunctional demethylmenaquinone methyltransferase/2-methoxy-6-polyprenyl-1,4-benzoquinol methylase [Clostridium kluyveri]UZQ51191.1 bifunctional demethylmenaquinone methyltransferase/2-methoxy-6-polyprenyl-1,4-benzoquinol methylase UbiE [Clostridium kluyveri]
MNNNSNVYNIFSSIANNYDRLNTILTLNIDSYWRKKAIRLCNINKNDKILDVCCGTGKMIEYACKAVGKNTEVIGLDFNEQMLSVGNIKLNQSIKDYKFKLIKGDILKLPFEDSSFDCVTVAFGLRNAKNRLKALCEIYRVLKWDGRLVCLELSNSSLPVFKNLYAIYFNYMLPIIGYLGTGDKTAYYYLRNSVNSFMSKAELQSAFQQVGFIDTGYLSLTGGIAAIHYGNKKLL